MKVILNKGSTATDFRNLLVALYQSKLEALQDGASRWQNPTPHTKPLLDQLEARSSLLSFLIKELEEMEIEETKNG